jgi:hypothetical protein
MFANGTWRPYAGIEAVILALVLLAIAGLFAWLGIRLQRPLAPERPGTVVRVLLVVLWLLSIPASGVAIGTYNQAFLARWGPNPGIPPNHVSPITDLAVLVTFALIAIKSRHHGWKIALGSAFICAAAAPLIFELPFDLMVMWRTFPAEPATRYTLLYFLPLFMVEVSTFALLTFSPLFRVTERSLFWLAAMFFVFAVWALFGLHYPNLPLPYALNVAGKLLAFVAAITMFWPARARAAA